MNYSKNEALGLIESTGMLPALEACDTMLKSANVELIAYENIGSTLVTIIVTGVLSDVKRAVENGLAIAEKRGTVTAANVMSRPEDFVEKVIGVHDLDLQIETQEDDNLDREEALASIEVFGLVYALEAGDAMRKAADVEVIGYENTASGYISILVEGDVTACEQAVQAGKKAVEAIGAEIYSSIVIPNPHPALYRIVDQYKFENLL